MGLDFLHSQNVVHRDVKPENILVTPMVKKHQGFKDTMYVVKLGDLGCARVLARDTGAPRGGAKSPLTLALGTQGSDGAFSTKTKQPTDEDGLAPSALSTLSPDGTVQAQIESAGRPGLQRRETANTKAFRSMIQDSRNATSCMTSEVGSLWYRHDSPSPNPDSIPNPNPNAYRQVPSPGST